MRSLLVLLMALLMMLVLAACGDSGNTAAITPTPEAAAAPTSSPVPLQTETATIDPSSSAGPGIEAIDPEIETVVTDFVSAQNAHDWDKFTGLWRKGAQRFLGEFFAYPDNEKNKSGYFAVENAELLSITPCLETDGGVLTEYELENYKEFRAFNVKVNYRLSTQFWGYSEGENSLELVLVKEDGAWKVSQDSLMIDWDPNDDYVYEDHSGHADGTVHFQKQITGYYLATEWADYAHIILMTIDGEQTELWKKCEIGTQTPFLQKMRITWTNSDSYVEEAGNVVNQDAATDREFID
ncbi:MAG: hypothetical protein AAGU74_08080 [Bacillota bacterium]